LILTFIGKTAFKLVFLFNKKLNKLRVLKFRLLGAKLGTNVKFFGRVVVVGHYSNIRIGDNCKINEGVLINSRSRVSIGDEVHLSAYVQIHTGKLKLYTKEGGHESLPVVIGSGCWLAGGVVVSPGVEIGSNVVVGANSVVNRSVGNNVFIAGLPAKIISNR